MTKRIDDAIRRPRLQPDEREVGALHATAAALEAEIIAQFEDFRFHRGGEPDGTQWKPLKADGKLRFFQGNQRYASQIPGPQEKLASKLSGNRVLLTGTIFGSIDDALFGCSFHDSSSLRANEAYQRSFLDDSAVLVTIDGPSLHDPFRFLGVTWHLRHSRLSKTRDCLLLQSTHLAVLRNGEQVGVSLRHSIDVPKIESLAATRVVLSSVTIFRQIDVETVEVFAIELLDDKRHAVDPVHRNEAVRDLLATVQVSETGFKKKLVWCIEQKRSQKTATSLAREDQKRCSLCESSTDGLLASTGIACQLCAKHVCSRCNVAYDLVLDESLQQVEMKSLAVCIECILLTKKLPTRRVAQEQTIQRALKNENGGLFV